MATLTATLAVILFAVTVASLLAAARFDRLAWQQAAAAAENERQARLAADEAKEHEAALRKQAEEAKKQAESNLQEAERQKKRAEANFTKARKAVDDYFTKVSESQLLQVPGMQLLRRDLLQSALTFYQDFLKERGDDPALRGELAAAYLRVGKIRSELGERSEARKAYEQARELYKVLTKDAPESVEWRHGLAQCFFWLGRIDEAITLWQKLVQPGQPRFQKELADAYNDRAIHYANADKHAEALAAHQQALAIREMLIRLHPDDSGAQRDLGATLNNIGVLLSKKGRFAEGLAMYRRAADHAEASFAQAPQVIVNGRFLAIQQNNIANIERQLGHVNEALAAYRRVVEVWRRLAQDNPAIPYLQSALWNAYWTLGKWQRELGQTAEAGRSARLAAEVIERLPKQTANDLFYLACARAQCSALIAQGKQKPAPAEQEESRRQADEAIEALRAAIIAGFTNVDQMKTIEDLAPLRKREEFRALLADLVAKTATAPSEKLKASQEALAQRQRLAAANRDNNRLQADLAASYRAVGSLQFQLSQEAAAAQSLERAVAMFDALRKKDPQNSAYQKELALTYQAQAPVQARQAWSLVACPELKLRNSKRAIELAKRSIEIAPKDGAYWSILGTAHYRAGDWKAAIAALEKAVDFGGLGSDYFVAAMTYKQLGDNHAARQWYNWAIQSMEERRPTLEKDQARWQELCAFQGEAAELLEIKAQTPAPEKPKAQAAAADASEIERLIEQLGSDSFTEREAASRRLEAIGEPAWNAVQKAARDSSDAEIRRRCKRAADAIGQRCFGEVRRFVGHKHWVRALAFSPDGRRAVSGGEDATVRLWEVASGKELRRFQGHTGTVWGVAFSPDGRYVLSGSGDKTARLWEVETGKELKRFEGHKGRVRSVAFSRDGRRILCCGGESVRLLDLATGKELKSFEGIITGSFHWAAFSPDERFLLAGDGHQGPGEGSVRLWEVASGKELRRMRGHLSAVGMVGFSPDGRLGVSSSLDRTVRLWDLKTGKELRCFRGHAEWVEAAVFSPDGRRILW